MIYNINTAITTAPKIPRKLDTVKAALLLGGVPCPSSGVVCCPPPTGVDPCLSSFVVDYCPPPAVVDPCPSSSVVVCCPPPAGVDPCPSSSVDVCCPPPAVVVDDNAVIACDCIIVQNVALS